MLDRKCSRFAPYGDLLWSETSTTDLDDAHEFADGIYEKYPDKILSQNCSPSFNWSMYLEELTIERFQEKMGAMGCKFQFVTLQIIYALNASMCELSKCYIMRGMVAFSVLQKHEFELHETEGFKSVNHHCGNQLF